MCSLLDNNFPLRTLDDIVEIPNCASCSRSLKKVESHWHCILCRKTKMEAKCPKNCRACIALFEDKWRFSALSKIEKESLKKKLFLFKLGIGDSDAEKSCELAKDSIPADQELSNTSIKKWKGVQRKELGNTLNSKSGKNNANEDKFKEKNSEEKLDDPFKKRLKGFETFLYQDLVIEFPADLVCEGFKMPEIPSRLLLKFKVTKNELIRLLATASLTYHLSNNMDQIGNDENLKMLDVNHVDSEFIGVELYASLIKFKANTLAQVIFQIRESILSRLYCRDQSIIPMMVRGPINPAISFFGNLDALQKAVKMDKRNVLSHLMEEITPESKKRKLQN